jgi:hypothetical protein
LTISALLGSLLVGFLGKPDLPVLAESDDHPQVVYLPVQVIADPLPAWLSYLNGIRSLGNIPPLGENSTWSDACVLHSRYMVKNDEMAHSEDPSNPWYTPAGDAAAGNSNLMMSTNVSKPDLQAIDMWLTGPFHGLGLLDPELGSTGFGSYRENDGAFQMGACVDVLRGLGSTSASVAYPIRWPENGRSLPYLAYTGGEMPNPLSGCPGYSVPSGPPIYLLLGRGEVTPNVTAHSFSANGQALAHCVYDETSYSGDYPDLGRSVLNSRDAVVLIPRQPLTAGVTYTVSITANGRTHSWRFTAGGTVPGALAADAPGSDLDLFAEPPAPAE